MNQSSSFQRVIRDILDLCELQMQLLSVDSQAAKRKLAKAIMCGSVAAVLAGSTLTVLLAACGLLLGELSQLSTGMAMLVVCAVMLVVVALLGGIALFAVKSAVAAMQETKSELAENLRWLKATLVSPDKSPRNQMRSEDFRGSQPVAPRRETDVGNFVYQSPSPLPPR